MEYRVSDTAGRGRPRCGDQTTLHDPEGLSRPVCSFAVYISSSQPLTGYQCLRIAFVTVLPVPSVRTGIGQF